MSNDGTAVEINHAGEVVAKAIRDCFSRYEDGDESSVLTILKDLAISAERIADAAEAIQSSIEAMEP